MKMGNENDLIHGMLLSANHVIRPITVQSSTSSSLGTTYTVLGALLLWFHAWVG